VPPVLLAAHLRRPFAAIATVGLFLGVGWLLATPTPAGKLAYQPLAMRPPDLCDIVMRGGRRAPSRRECDLLAESFPAGARFATIQQNNPGSLAAWTRPRCSLAAAASTSSPGSDPSYWMSWPPAWKAARST
jgi:hypothetical protein